LIPDDAKQDYAEQRPDASGLPARSGTSFSSKPALILHDLNASGGLADRPRLMTVSGTLRLFGAPK
jgi:hypothetical protein